MNLQNKVTGVENKFMVTGGQGVGVWDTLGDRDGHVYATIYKIDNWR